MSFIKESEQMGWLFQKKPEGTKITHTLMNGAGVLVVPLQQRDKFYEVCMNSLANKEMLFMVEQTKSADRFRMFLDIDYLTTKEHGAVTDASIKRWASHIFTAFPSLGPILVSVCIREQGEHYKNGIHMLWPKTTVTYTSAMSIFNRVLVTLTDHDDSVSWCDVLDKSVFKTGLRTIWSHKIKRDTREISVPYMPRFEVNADGLVELFKVKPDVSMFEKFSILPHGNETNHFGSDETIISGTSVDDELVNWLKEIYPRHKISGIDKVIPKKTYWIISTRCKYCEFIEREHQGNHSWFLVDRETKTIASKCHDEEHKNLSGKRKMVNPKIIKYLQGLNKV